MLRLLLCDQNFQMSESESDGVENGNHPVRLDLGEV